MKNKYSKELIFNYVNGNDIAPFDIDELENDCAFMMQVIDYTKDKNMYNLCSDELKNNYNFLKFMINTFSNDKKFIVSLANDYLAKHNDDEDITVMELNIMMSNKLGGFDNFDSWDYCIKSSSYYSLEMTKISNILEKEPDKNIVDKLGLGFFIINDTFNNSEEILNFFANRLINEIFDTEKEITLEENIHKHFKTPDSLKNYGINNYILNYIGKYDQYLKDYVSRHINLIQNKKQEINRIINNWDNYMENINQRRISIFYQEVFDYMEEDLLLSFSWYEIIIYVIEKLKLEDLFKKYDEDYIQMKKDFELKGTINLKKLDLNELKCINYVITLAKQLFNQDIIDTSIENYGLPKVKEKKGSNVVKVNFKRN